MVTSISLEKKKKIVPVILSQSDGQFAAEHRKLAIKLAEEVRDDFSKKKKMGRFSWIFFGIVPCCSN